MPVEFKLEHKMANIFKKGAYFLKAHYGFLRYNEKEQIYNEFFFKVRGVSQRDIDNPLIQANPIYYLLKDILEGKTKFVFDEHYQNSKLVTLKEFRKSLYQVRGEYISKLGHDVKPGDSIILHKTFRINNSYCFLNDEAEFKKRNRRSLRYVSKEGTENKVRQELFEKYFKTYSIQEVVQFINDDNL